MTKQELDYAELIMRKQKLNTELMQQIHKEFIDIKITLERINKIIGLTSKVH